MLLQAGRCVQRWAQRGSSAANRQGVKVKSNCNAHTHTHTRWHVGPRGRIHTLWTLSHLGFLRLQASYTFYWELSDRFLTSRSKCHKRKENYAWFCIATSGKKSGVHMYSVPSTMNKIHIHKPTRTWPSIWSDRLWKRSIDQIWRRCRDPPAGCHDDLHRSGLALKNCMLAGIVDKMSGLCHEPKLGTKQTYWR